MLSEYLGLFLMTTMVAVVVAALFRWLDWRSEQASRSERAVAQQQSAEYHRWHLRRMRLECRRLRQQLDRGFD